MEHEYLAEGLTPIGLECHEVTLCMPMKSFTSAQWWICE